MPAKKKSRTKAITDNDILAMYEAVLPLLYDNTKALNLGDQVNKQIFSLIQFDFIHYVMEAERAERVFDATISRWTGFGQGDEEVGISVNEKRDKRDVEPPFVEDAKSNYDLIVGLYKKDHPDQKDFHYHRIASHDYPQIVVGFFREKTGSPKNGFTNEEVRKFDLLSPHILLLFRTVLTQMQRSAIFQYFDSFAKIGSHIAAEFELSETETKLISDILFGYSNEEIAERHFVSHATVKTHINHIFKKTGTKNRVDFISKFFTSPEHVQL